MQNKLSYFYSHPKELLLLCSNCQKHESSRKDNTFFYSCLKQELFLCLNSSNSMGDKHLEHNSCKHLEQRLIYKIQCSDVSKNSLISLAFYCHPSTAFEAICPVLYAFSLFEILPGEFLREKYSREAIPWLC